MADKTLFEKKQIMSNQDFTLKPLFGDVEVIREHLAKGCFDGLTAIGRDPGAISTKDALKLYMAAVTLTQCLKVLLTTHGVAAQILDHARVRMTQRSQADPIIELRSLAREEQAP